MTAIEDIILKDPANSWFKFMNQLFNILLNIDDNLYESSRKLKQPTFFVSPEDGKI